MQRIPLTRPSRPYTRSPLLLLAYGALCATFANLFLRTGLIWIAGSALLAVLLGTAEVIIQLRRRRASA
jgi:uncharacterized membrane protein YjjP (DUF1212 family)